MEEPRKIDSTTVEHAAPERIAELLPTRRGFCAAYSVPLTMDRREQASIAFGQKRQLSRAMCLKNPGKNSLYQTGIFPPRSRRCFVGGLPGRAANGGACPHSIAPADMGREHSASFRFDGAFSSITSLCFSPRRNGRPRPYTSAPPTLDPLSR